MDGLLRGSKEGMVRGAMEGLTRGSDGGIDERFSETKKSVKHNLWKAGFQHCRDPVGQNKWLL